MCSLGTHDMKLFHESIGSQMGSVIVALSFFGAAVGGVNIAVHSDGGIRGPPVGMV